jgi:hypothetical protein
VGHRAPSELMETTPVPRVEPSHVAAARSLSASAPQPVLRAPYSASGSVAQHVPPPARRGAGFAIAAVCAIGIGIALAIAFRHRGGQGATSVDAAVTIVEAPAPAPAAPPAPAVAPRPALPDAAPAAAVEPEPPPEPPPPSHAHLRPAAGPDATKLFEAGRHSEVVAACSGSTAVSAQYSSVCVLSACHIHDAAKARRWLKNAGSKRAALISACEAAGVELAPPAEPQPPPKSHDCEADPLSCQH